MRLQCEPSNKIVLVDGTPCRIWSAVTEDGDVCALLVALVAVPVPTRLDVSELQPMPGYMVQLRTADGKGVEFEWN